MKLIRPALYYCKHGTNDAGWIIQRMKVIPEALRLEVTNEYERLVKPNNGCSGRRVANEYLESVAVKYRVNRDRKPAEPRAKLDLDRILRKKPSEPVKQPGKKYNSDCGLWRKKI